LLIGRVAKLERLGLAEQVGSPNANPLLKPGRAGRADVFRGDAGASPRRGLLTR